jgi:hypothetical protein
MTRRERKRVLLSRIAAIFVVASFLTVPVVQTDAHLQEDEIGRPAQSLIGEKLETDEIDYETSLVYRAYALFDDPRLPGDLAGSGSLGEDNGFFGEVKYTWSQLSPATRALLTPFVVRPTDSRSIFFKSLADGPRVIPEASAPPSYAAGNCSDNWISKDSPNFPFKVWTHCTGDYEADLAEAIRIVDDFWEREVAFMGPPILDTGSAPRHGGDYISEEALAHAAPDEPVVDRASSGYIVARRPNIGDPDLILTMAHEFFHTLQQAHNWEIAFGFKGNPYSADFDTLSFSEFWFVEATAMWVESYLYRHEIDPAVMQLSIHYRFFGSFQGVDRPLHYSPRQGGIDFIHIYGAYIYFLFLEQEVGPEAIAQLWENLEPLAPDDFDGTMQVINEILPFAENFREFTVRNLNLNLLPGDPISPSYADLDPTLFEGYAPPMQNGNGQTSRTEILRNEPLTFEDTIPSLSAHYYNFDTDPDATRLTLDFTDLAPNDAVDIDLITKVRGQAWERRQVDPSQPITFCREIPEDALSIFYLVVTNHDMKESTSVRGDFTVAADEVPCAPEQEP